jgi:hypothetical protein
MLEKLEVVYHPSNRYPVYVGFVGCVAFDPQIMVWLDTDVPLLLLNVTVYLVKESFTESLVADPE